MRGTAAQSRRLRDVLKTSAELCALTKNDQLSTAELCDHKEKYILCTVSWESGCGVLSISTSVVSRVLSIYSWASESGVLSICTGVVSISAGVHSHIHHCHRYQFSCTWLLTPPLPQGIFLLYAVSNPIFIIYRIQVIFDPHRRNM